MEEQRREREREREGREGKARRAGLVGFCARFLRGLGKVSQAAIDSLGWPFFSTVVQVEKVTMLLEDAFHSGTQHRSLYSSVLDHCTHAYALCLYVYVYGWLDVRSSFAAGIGRAALTKSVSTVENSTTHGSTGQLVRQAPYSIILLTLSLHYLWQLP